MPAVRGHDSARPTHPTKRSSEENSAAGPHQPLVSQRAANLRSSFQKSRGAVLYNYSEELMPSVELVSVGETTNCIEE